jgi:anti-sigma B factor antagonist
VVIGARSVRTDGDIVTPGPVASAPMLFDLQVHALDGWTVVAPVGELDLGSVPRLRQELQNLTANAGTLSVVLDLAGVDFIDSIGLGVIVAVAKRVRAHGGQFRLARVDDRVWSVFELVGLDVVFRRYADLGTACAD